MVKLIALSVLAAGTAIALYDGMKDDFKVMAMVGLMWFLVAIQTLLGDDWNY